MQIRKMLTPNNTTPLRAEKTAALANGTTLEQALYQAHIEQDFEAFYAALKAHLNISVVADVVKDFVESSVLIDTVKGYVNLNGISHYLNNFFSYEKLFRADFSGLFPAFYLNSDMWLLIETGELLVLHHDSTFDEVAADVMANLKTAVSTPLNAKSFNKAFAAAGSCIHIGQLVQLQTEWFDLGIVNNWGADDEVQEKAALHIVQRMLNCSVEELENAVNKRCLEFVYQLCYMFIEDYDGFNQMKSG